MHSQSCMLGATDRCGAPTANRSVRAQHVLVHASSGSSQAMNELCRRVPLATCSAWRQCFEGRSGPIRGGRRSARIWLKSKKVNIIVQYSLTGALASCRMFTSVEVRLSTPEAKMTISGRIMRPRIQAHSFSRRQRYPTDRVGHLAERVDAMSSIRLPFQPIFCHPTALLVHRVSVSLDRGGGRCKVVNADAE